MTLADKLAEWNRCNEERVRLSREAEPFKKRCAQLEDEFEEILEKTGKDSIKRHGFKLFWGEGKATVSWAGEFLKAFGPDKVAELKKQAALAAKKTFCIEAPIE